MILCWVIFIAILGCMQRMGHGLDTPAIGEFYPGQGTQLQAISSSAMCAAALFVKGPNKSKREKSWMLTRLKGGTEGRKTYWVDRAA